MNVFPRKAFTVLTIAAKRLAQGIRLLHCKGNNGKVYLSNKGVRLFRYAYASVAKDNSIKYGGFHMRKFLAVVLSMMLLATLIVLPASAATSGVFALRHW